VDAAEPHRVELAGDDRVAGRRYAPRLEQQIVHILPQVRLRTSKQQVSCRLKTGIRTATRMGTSRGAWKATLTDPSTHDLSTLT